MSTAFYSTKKGICYVDTAAHYHFNSLKGDDSSKDRSANESTCVDATLVGTTTQGPTAHLNGCRYSCSILACFKVIWRVSL